MRTLLTMAAVLATAALATAQIGIPPHSSVYNGFSRGFNFTSNIAFNIVGLDLPLDAFQAGDTASYAVQINGVPVLTSVGNAGAISTGIQVLPGDIVDIAGNWSPAAPGTFSAHNSYGSSAPYATTIEGVAHTLNRTGVQDDIGNPAWVPGTGWLAPGSGSIGRVLVFTSSSGGTVATNTTLGAGCGGSPLGDGTFYEVFDAANPVDIANTSYTLTWTGSGYVVIPGATPLVPPTSANIGLGDDVVVPVTLPYSIPTPQGLLDTLYLGSNGYLGFQAGLPGDFTESVAELLAQQTRLAFFWDDLEPNASGSVTTELDGAGVYQITFTDVPEWGTTNLNTFQISLNPNGDIELKYGNIGSSTGIVGLSTGNGATDPGAIDLMTALPLVVDTGVFVPDLTLGAATRPVLGTSWDLDVDGIPAGTLFGLTLFGSSNPNVPDLAIIGAPGCGLFSSLDLVDGPWLPTGSSYSYSFAVPALPVSLIGFELFTQTAVAPLPAPNAFGWITSNGIKGTLGDV